MKPRIALLIAALAAPAAGSQPPPVATARSTVTELAGRVAGKPRRCVSVEPGRLFSTSEADPHILLYDDGRTIWASDLGPSCGFEPSQTVVPDESASYYCQGDSVRAGARITLIPGGRCALGRFTPYRSK